MASGISAVQLRPLLVDAGLMPAQDFDSAAGEAEKRKIPIDQMLIEKDLIPDQYLGQIVAEAIGVPFASFEPESIPDHVLRIVPDRVAVKTRVAAFGIDDGTLRLAMRDPGDLAFRYLIEKKTGLRAVPHYVTERAFQTILERYRKDLDSAVKNLIDEAAAKSGKKKGKGGDEEDGTAVNIVDLLMQYGYNNNASDVHIEPRESEVVVRYRIDGILHDVVNFPKGLLNSVVTRIKVLGKLRTDEHFAAQDGKFQQIVGGERMDVRVSVIPIVYGEKVVMRLLTEKGKSFSLQELGMLEDDLKKLGKHMNKSFGMILSTGPTGSGKTTTMYAVLKILNTPDVNIATIEDPIEYALAGVNQIQVNVKTGLTFANGLRSIVRQDPDIVMVGEIRDEETAGISVNAAMTGHLVLSTLHTNDAATALPRFLDMKVEPFLIASTINVIIGQRLVRKICSRCIVSVDVSVEELKKTLPTSALAALPKRKKNVSVFKGKGCGSCGHSGYKGRIGIYELLEMSDAIRDLLMKGANASEINAAAVRQGMTTMLQDGVKKAIQGLTTIEEVLRAAGV